jgi:ankyrin repeat protein
MRIDVLSHTINGVTVDGRTQIECELQIAHDHENLEIKVRMFEVFKDGDVIPISGSVDDDPLLCDIITNNVRAWVFDTMNVSEGNLQIGVLFREPKSLNLIEPILSADELKTKTKETYENEIASQSGSISDDELKETLEKEPLLIFKYVEKDNLEMVARSVKVNHSLLDEVNPENGYTPLFLATKMGLFEIVKYLLSKGANPNIRDKDGNTVLYFAVVNNDERMIIEIVKNMDLSLMDEERNKIFNIAKDMKNPMLFDRILEKMLLRRDSREPLEGMLPIFLASEKGLFNTVKMLVEDKGVNVNVIDKHRRTPLSLATQEANEFIVEYLLEHEANPNIRGEDGLAPLHFASQQGLVEIAELLLKNKADPEAKDNSGLTPLHYAAKMGENEIIDMLLKYTPHVNVKDNFGNTPLYWAVIQDHTDTVKCLLGHRANPVLKNNANKTPLDKALANNRKEMVELIQKAQRKTNL